MRVTPRTVSSQHPRHLYRRLLREARPFWRHIGGLLTLGALSSIFTLLTPLPLKIAVDSVIGTEPMPSWLVTIIGEGRVAGSGQVLIFAVALVLAIAAVGQGQRFATWILQSWTGERIVLAFRAQLLRQALSERRAGVLELFGHLAGWLPRHHQQRLRWRRRRAQLPR